MLSSEYEGHLATQPDQVRAMRQSPTRVPGGLCVECGRCWPCAHFTSTEGTSMEDAERLLCAPRPAPPVSPRDRTPLAPPAPGRTQLNRRPVDGHNKWVVIAVGPPVAEDR
jgi:hypothetical protein